MKRVLIGLILIFSTTPALARISMVTGRGQSFGFCDHVMGNGCIRQLENRAESDGSLDAVQRCQMQRGQPRGITRCNTYCSPSFMPPGSQPTHVRCSSTCSLSCEVP